LSLELHGITILLEGSPRHVVAEAPRSTVGDAPLLAVDGAPAAAASTAVSLAGAAEGGEATVWAGHPLLVAGPLLGADDGGPNHATARVPAGRAAEAAAPPATDPGRDVEPAAVAEEPARVGTEPGDAGSIVVFAVALALGELRFQVVRGGKDEDEDEEKASFLHSLFSLLSVLVLLLLQLGIPGGEWSPQSCKASRDVVEG
ncbi:unnamed protein product, partial [Musa acuminata subsp. malaccensis]